MVHARVAAALFVLATLTPGVAHADPTPDPTATAADFCSEHPYITDCPGLPTPTPSPGPNVGQRGFLLRVPDPDPCAAGCALTLTVPPAPDAQFAPLIRGVLDGIPYLGTSAVIAPVIVTDTRLGRLPWRLTGQISGFYSGGGTVPAKYAGVGPGLGHGSSALLGDNVEPAYPALGDGLAVPRVLASALAGHAGSDDTYTEVTGRIIVRLPVTTPGGNYRATLTLTLMS